MENGDTTEGAITDESICQDIEEARSDIVGLDEQRIDIEHVSEYVRRHKAITEQIATVRKQASVIIKQLERRVDVLERAIADDIEHHVAALTSSTKKRSIDTLYGRAGFRKSKGKVRVVDEAAFLNWLHEQPLEIQKRLSTCMQTRVVRTTPISEYINDTAEIPLGIAYTPPGDDFYPRTKGSNHANIIEA